MTKTFKTLTAATLIALGTAGLVNAQSAIPPGDDGFTGYGTVEGWNIFVDNACKTCLIETIDPVGNVVQMGLTEDRGMGYVGVFTKADIGAKKGKTEEVAILIGENMYIGESTQMKGNITDGYSSGYVLSDNPQFVQDLANQYEMVVFPEQDYAFTVNLDGTKKAIEAAAACNQEQLGG